MLLMGGRRCLHSELVPVRDIVITILLMIGRMIRWRIRINTRGQKRIQTLPVSEADRFDYNEEGIQIFIQKKETGATYSVLSMLPTPFLGP